jgi:hypothetical protein
MQRFHLHVLTKPERIYCGEFSEVTPVRTHWVQVKVLTRF